MWRRSGLEMEIANAVYMRWNSEGVLCRFVDEQDGNGKVVVGGRFDANTPACSHNDVRYIKSVRKTWFD